MKKISLSLFTAALIVIAIGSCKKICTETNAPNFGQDAPCTDLTTSLVGIYLGAFADSAINVSGHVTNSQTVLVTKVDDATVLFTPSDTTFFAFKASITQSGGGYVLSIPSGIFQGISYVGLAYSGAPSVNGAYDASSRQLATYITMSSGTELEIFMGTKQ